MGMMFKLMLYGEESLSLGQGAGGGEMPKSYIRSPPRLEGCRRVCDLSDFNCLHYQ